MEIEFKKKNVINRFEDIKVGKCFMFRDKLYLKCGDDTDGFNVICLSNNKLTYFSNDNDSDYSSGYNEYEIVNAKIVVED